MKLGRVTSMENVWIPAGILTVDVPNATSISSMANKTSLDSFSADSMQSVPDDEFQGCGNLQTVSFQNATSVGDSAFEGCAALRSIDLPAVTTIGTNGFKDCENLGSGGPLVFANVTDVGAAAFSGCSGATYMSFPRIVSGSKIGPSAFMGCTALTTLNLENLSSYTVSLNLPSWFGSDYEEKFNNLTIHCQDGLVIVANGETDRKYDCFIYNDAQYIVGIDETKPFVGDAVEGYALGIASNVCAANPSVRNM